MTVTLSPPVGPGPLWEELASSMAGLDEEIPSDGAREHDHYIYGSPKP